MDIAVCDLQMEGMDGLAFMRRVGLSGQVKSIIISSALSADLRRAAHQIIALLGLELLGDVGKPLHADVLGPLLARYQGACTPEKMPGSVVQLACEDEVRQALALQQLQAWYQPKFNLQTGKVCGAEVLCRWLHPSKGVLPPAVFIPVLERCGLMDELLFAQLNQALSLQERARIQGFALNMAFNLQTAQLANTPADLYPQGDSGSPCDARLPADLRADRKRTAASSGCQPGESGAPANDGLPVVDRRLWCRVLLVATAVSVAVQRDQARRRVCPSPGA